MNLKRQHSGGPAKAGGFTMIEIALSLAVIGFALVAIIGVLPAGMSVQRDNRESTQINFDANFLMDAITMGAPSADDLTNKVIAITNYLTQCTTAGAATLRQFIVGYTTTGTYVNGAQVAASYLTNGQSIISLLTTPKYISTVNPNGNTVYYSNYTTADFRANTGSLTDEGTSQTAQSFAFAYRIFPEVIPYLAAGATPWTNSPDSGPVADSFQANFTQIRLRFRWPIYPNGSVGTSRLTFRTAASGTLTTLPAFAGVAVPVGPALIQPGNFVGKP